MTKLRQTPSQRLERLQQKRQARRARVRPRAKRVLKNEDRNDLLRPATCLAEGSVIGDAKIASEPMYYSLHERRAKWLLRPDAVEALRVSLSRVHDGDYASAGIGINRGP